MKMIARLPVSQLSADETHVDALKALAHLSRLQVFFVSRRPGKSCRSEISRRPWRSRADPSHHLDVLRRASLIESRKEERYIYYSVQRDPVSALVRLLTACC